MRKTHPKADDTRIRIRFALLPVKAIDKRLGTKQTRWLEKVTTLQYYSNIGSRWYDGNFIDE